MLEGLNKLKNRILNKDEKPSLVTDILEMAKEFGCVGLVTGVNYEVFDKHGELLYRVHQKPLAICQVNTLLKELEEIGKRQDKRMKKHMPKSKRGKR